MRLMTEYECAFLVAQAMQEEGIAFRLNCSHNGEKKPSLC